MLLFERKAHYSNESHNTQVDYIIVYNRQGGILADTFAGDVPLDVRTAPTLPPNQHSIAVDRPEPEPGLIEVRASAPTVTVRMGFSRSDIQSTVNNVTVQLLLITAVMVGVGLAAAMLLTWILTRPVLSLVEATRAIARGDYSRRVPRWAQDEIGELAQSFNQMTAALARAETIRARYISGVIAAQEEERQRIARELHDSTGQSLTSLLVGLRNLEDAPSDGVDDQLSDLRDIVSNTLDEIHGMVLQLRPPVLDDLGLSAALERQVADFTRRYGVPVDIVAHLPDNRLSFDMETAVYRIVQEGLTNIARHAEATNASVLLEKRGGTLLVIIEDDGSGFDLPAVRAAGERLGLQGIEERTRLLGGTLTIESTPGQGTSLFVRLPLAMTDEVPAAESNPDRI
jgi:signal transduction histidine kinase